MPPRRSKKSSGYPSKAVDKLAESGLTVEDAQTLGILPLTADSTYKLFPRKASNRVVSLKIQYFDLHGQLIPTVYRVRLLDAPKPGRFGELPSKVYRYLQPPDTPPTAYFPQNVDWKTTAADPSTTILITEGELKAACASKHGFPTIALGGVYSFRSADRGWSFLPELEDIVWEARDVVVVYDSDAATNPAVANATSLLVAELLRRGASPRVATIPSVGDQKIGLDDLIVASGVEALEAILDDAIADELGIKLHDFNRRFGFVLAPCVVYDEERRDIYTPRKFADEIFANVWATKQVAGKDGPRLENVRVAPQWIQWPMRRQYDQLTYAPGQDTIVDQTKRNEWRGWGCVAQEGGIKPWKDLLDYLFEGETVEAREWFENWCLYPLKYPGTKLLSAVGIWSTPQGLGKSVVGFTLGRVYGADNFSCITQRQLDSDFNSWAARKQFVMVDDLSAYQNHSKAAIFKSLITQEIVNVNIKHVPEYTLPDTVNYYMTSNKPNALYLDPLDRRFFIHEVTAPRRSQKFYDVYHAWLQGAGPGALLWYAQHVHDFGSFLPHVEPPRTTSKEDMTTHGMGEVDLWLSDLKEDPDHFLRVGAVVLQRDIYTPAELLELFEPTRKGRSVTVAQFSTRLREHFTRTRPARFRVGDNKERFYVVRNVKKWQNADVDHLREHVLQGRKREGGGGGDQNF